MADLRDSRLMILKAVLFVAIGLIAGSMLILESPTLKTVLLLCLCVWAFARAYYFAFYVIQHYIDPQYKFAGLWSALRYLMARSQRP